MKTILVLDDESVLRNLLVSVLGKHYTVIEAATAGQALRLFNAHSRQVDLLLADVTLPKSSGIQVALTLRTAIPSLPVLLTSGYPVGSWSIQNAADLERLGSRSLRIFQKPFQGRDIFNAICELLAPALSASPTAA
jgi:CheY-like chemotaxis protein